MRLTGKTGQKLHTFDFGQTDDGHLIIHAVRWTEDAQYETTITDIFHPADIDNLIEFLQKVRAS